MTAIYTSMKPFVRDLRYRIRNKYDSVILVSGENGEGKTTCAIQLGKAISFENFIINKDYVSLSPTFNTLLDFVENKPFYSTQVNDECVDLIYKLNWNSAEQKKTNSLMIKCRKDFKCLIFCIPRFTDANEYFRNDRVMFHIYVPKRGKAFIFRKNSTLFNKDSFNVISNEARLKKFLKDRAMHEVALEVYYCALRKLDGYIGEFDFDPLSEEDQNSYDELASLTKYDSFLNDSRSDVQKALECSIKKFMSLGITQVDIAKTIGYNSARVNKIVSRMREKGELTKDDK